MVFPKVEIGAFSHVMDYKSQLQEIIQQKNNGMLNYEIVEEKGPAHNRTFVSRVMLNYKELGLGMVDRKKKQNNKLHRIAIIALKDYETGGIIICSLND